MLKFLQLGLSTIAALLVKMTPLTCCLDAQCPGCSPGAAAGRRAPAGMHPGHPGAKSALVKDSPLFPPGAAAGGAAAGGAHTGHPGAGGPRPGGPRPAAPRLARGRAAVGVCDGVSCGGRVRPQATEQRGNVGLTAACTVLRQLPAVLEHEQSRITLKSSSRTAAG